jgi:hypothetical protein
MSLHNLFDKSYHSFKQVFYQNSSSNSILDSSDFEFRIQPLSFTAKDNLELEKRTQIQHFLTEVKDSHVIWSDYIDYFNTMNCDSTTSSKSTRIISVSNQCISIWKPINNKSTTDDFLIRNIGFKEVDCIIHEPVKSSEGIVCIKLKREVKEEEAAEESEHQHHQQQPQEEEEEESDLVFVCYRKLELFEYLIRSFEVRKLKLDIFVCTLLNIIKY